MNVQTITLDLPEDIYRQFQYMAETSRQPLETVVFQSIQGNLPPSVEDVPPEWRNELVSLQKLDDQALWQVAQASLPASQWRRHQHLLRKNQAGTLTEAERTELTHLRTAADHFVLRRSYALALLKWRGYTVPVPEGLPSRASTS
jgi:hypothetical protein